jgi:hypothetical protein
MRPAARLHFVARLRHRASFPCSKLVPTVPRRDALSWTLRRPLSPRPPVPAAGCPVLDGSPSLFCPPPRAKSGRRSVQDNASHRRAVRRERERRRGRRSVQDTASPRRSGGTSAKKNSSRRSSVGMPCLGRSPVPLPSSAPGRRGTPERPGLVRGSPRAHRIPTPERGDEESPPEGSNTFGRVIGPPGALA